MWKELVRIEYIVLYANVTFEIVHCACMLLDLLKMFRDSLKCQRAAPSFEISHKHNVINLKWFLFLTAFDICATLQIASCN